ncbi:hypothetical protein NX059_012372 [Plenodomus lindquistii]|nr:hypothetical protein NX059_012372 [Plenodomus lindquistii]
MNKNLEKQLKKRKRRRARAKVNAVLVLDSAWRVPLRSGINAFGHDDCGRDARGGHAYGDDDQSHHCPSLQAAQKDPPDHSHHYQGIHIQTPRDRGERESARSEERGEVPREE